MRIQTLATPDSGFNHGRDYGNVRRPKPNSHQAHVTMSLLSNDDVKKIAHLARLALTEQESKDFAGSLSQILGLIEQMNAVDTTGVEPMAHPSDTALRLRQDEVKERDQRDRFQAVAPLTEAGLYLVPKVLE